MGRARSLGAGGLSLIVNLKGAGQLSERHSPVLGAWDSVGLRGRCGAFVRSYEDAEPARGYVAAGAPLIANAHSASATFVACNHIFSFMALRS